MFLLNSIGRLIDGCEASEMRREISDEYRNGIERSVNPRVRNWAKIRNNVADLSPIRIDSPIDMVDVESDFR